MFIRSFAASSAALAVALTAAAPARADEGAPAPPPPATAPAAGFGQSGQVALSIGEGLNLTLGDLLMGSEFGLSYFVTNHLSLGTSIGAQWYSVSPAAGQGSSSSDGFMFRAGPRIGYDAPISDVVSLWPQIGVDIRHTNGSTGTNSANSSTDSVSFAASVPLLLHPVKGFFVGAGPSFSTDLLSKTNVGDAAKTTSLGLGAVIGGAF